MAAPLHLGLDQHSEEAAPLSASTMAAAKAGYDWDEGQSPSARYFGETAHGAHNAQQAFFMAPFGFEAVITETPELNTSVAGQQAAFMVPMETMGPAAAGFYLPNGQPWLTQPANSVTVGVDASCVAVQGEEVVSAIATEQGVIEFQEASQGRVPKAVFVDLSCLREVPQGNSSAPTLNSSYNDQGGARSCAGEMAGTGRSWGGHSQHRGDRRRKV